MIAGVNGAMPEPFEEQRETDRHVVLRTKPPAEVGNASTPYCSELPTRDPLISRAWNPHARSTTTTTTTSATTTTTTTSATTTTTTTATVTTTAIARLAWLLLRWQVVGVRRDRKFSLFTVDLRRFKNVETMKGDQIGVRALLGCLEGARGGGVCLFERGSLEQQWRARASHKTSHFFRRLFLVLVVIVIVVVVAVVSSRPLPFLQVDGAVFLGQMLRQGCCGRLRHLNLGWNRIKKAGCDRLFDAFGKLGKACQVKLLLLASCPDFGST